MTDVHLEIKGIRKYIKDDLESNGNSSTPNWRGLVATVKDDRAKSHLKDARGEYFNDPASILEDPLGTPLEYRVCEKCRKPVSLSALVDHLQIHCKGLTQDKAGGDPEGSIKTEDTEVMDDISGSGDKKKNLQSSSKRSTPFETDPKPETSPAVKKQRKAGSTPVPSKAKRRIKQRNPTEKHLIDFDKQCGVELAEGGYCGRSLTCKSHSVGTKRAVKGRSQPFDVLLSQYQKKNQLKTNTNSKQKTKTATQQPQSQQGQNSEINEGLPVEISPEEETTQVLNGVSRSLPLPLETNVLGSSRLRTKYFRMREMFASSFSVRPGFSAPGYGAIHSRVGCIDLDRTTDYTFRIRTPQLINNMNPNNLTPQQRQKIQQQRMLQAQMLAEQQQHQQQQQPQHQVQQMQQRQQQQQNAQFQHQQQHTPGTIQQHQANPSPSFLQQQQQIQNGRLQQKNQGSLSQADLESGLTPQGIQKQQQRLRQQQVQQQRFEAAAYHLATATKLMQNGPKNQAASQNAGVNSAVGSPVNMANSRSNSNPLNVTPGGDQR
ncbi:LAFA_0G20670g1_1 [Lachancea sp. 'fantastica']|nr:LAFA_0G20670g1_1 [Lachancea sp. 'fantastica']